MLIVKSMWSKGQCNSCKIKWLSISMEFDQRNMRSITELESLRILV